MAQEKLKEAKILYESANTDQKYVLESLFPELKESEDDGIRKEIISALKWANHRGIYDKHIAWLEKQGKQKPFDYENVNIPQRDFAPKSAMEAINEEKVDNANKVIVKPIFKIGNFIVDNCGYIWKIVGIINQFYILEGVEGGESRPTIEFVNQTFHRWTIKDAKDGDILMTKEEKRPFIFKDLSDKFHPESPVAYCGIDVLDHFMIGSSCDFWWTNEEICPAMNEEREFLFDKMKEEGYEWDVEKKELRKIEQKPTYEEMQELLRTEYEKGRSDAIGEFQKYAWSDKDEEILLKIMFAFKTGVFPSSKECDSFIEFLKSIKDKFSQNKIDTVVCDCVENQVK